MATEEQWGAYTGGLWEGKQSGNAAFAQKCRDTPLTAEAILTLVWGNIEYFGDHYYECITHPIEMRVAEYEESHDLRNDG